MQPSYTPNSRQRPLQKSMFLPSNEQYLPRNNSVQYQYQDIMKRSAINADTNKPNNYQVNQNNNGIFQMSQNSNNFVMGQNSGLQSPINQYNNANGLLSFNSTPRNKQNAKINAFSNNQDPIINQLQQKISKLSFLVQNHEQILKKHNLTNIKQKTLIQSQIEEIQNRLKSSVLPELINKETKDIYEHIFNFKVEVNTFKEQLTEINRKLSGEASKTDINSNNLNSQANNGIDKTLLRSIQSAVQSKFEQKEQEMLKGITTVQNRLTEVEKNLRACVEQQISRNKLSLSNQKSPSKSIKQSTIQSTLSPILLQYRELFILKNPTSSNTPSLQKSKQQAQILISSCLYYIDKQGYLLDNQNRYIIDGKGFQIKLQEKHLSLLRQHKVLN